MHAFQIFGYITYVDVFFNSFYTECIIVPYLFKTPVMSCVGKTHDGSVPARYLFQCCFQRLLLLFLVHSLKKSLIAFSSITQDGKPRQIHVVFHGTRQVHVVFRSRHCSILMQYPALRNETVQVQIFVVKTKASLTTPVSVRLHIDRNLNG